MSKEKVPEKTEQSVNTSKSDVPGGDFDNFLASPTKKNVESRWILSVLDGPNCGAQLSLSIDKTYVLGSDKSCDIVLLDPSVSKKHLEIKLESGSRISIKDLNSANGTTINGKIATNYNDEGTVVMRLGNSSIIITDTASEQKTIVVTNDTAVNPSPHVQEIKSNSSESVFYSLITDKLKIRRISAIAASVIFILISSLFIERPLEKGALETVDEGAIKSIMSDKTFSFSFDEKKKQVVLHGHVLSEEEKNLTISKLKALPFVASIDSRRLVLDNLLCKEFNSVITNQWPSISIKATAPGKYSIQGFIKNKIDSDKINIYLQLNFPYLEDLTNEITVEEVAVEQLNEQLQVIAHNRLAAQITDGELIVVGSIPDNKEKELTELLDQFKKTYRIKTIKKSFTVQKSVQETDNELSAIDISNDFEVAGYVKRGRNFEVLINGKILNKGSNLDKMTVVDIKNGSVLLEKDGELFKIAFNSNG